MITWKQIKLACAVGAGLITAAMQLDSYVNRQIETAVQAHAASKDDINRLETKIDKLTDFLLNTSAHRR